MLEGPSKKVKEEFVSVLFEAISNIYPELKVERLQVRLSVTVPDPAMGDLSSSVAFRLSKMLKRNPSDIARELADSAKGLAYVSKVIESKGYVNLFLDEKEYANLVFSTVVHDPTLYGSSEIGDGTKVIVEYPSVNPTKPWHVGHLRNALLGDAISNIAQFCGYRVERTDYINDLGLQTAETVWGFMNLSDKPEGKFDFWLGEQYVKVNAMAKEKQEELNAILKKMEEGSNEIATKAREISEKAVASQQETAFSYGIYRDVLIWESDIVRADLYGRAIRLIKEKGIAETPSSGEYAGCVIVNLEKVQHIAKEFENPEEKIKVLVRSNGVATYVAKDFAFDMWKFGLIDANFQYKRFAVQPNLKALYTTTQSGRDMAFGKADRVINVIGAAQKFPQMILKAMLYLMGHEEQANNKVHLAYGEVALRSGTISGRQGTWIKEGMNYTADDLLRETKKRAIDIASKSEKITNKNDLEDIANAIALSAIKFEYLRVAPEKGFVFSWESALNFEGNSGPYALYTFARASKILDKAGYFEPVPINSDMELMTRGYDFELVKAIGMAQEMVEKACAEMRPNLITDYLLNLSSLFSKFYETMPVINGKEAKNVRLSVVNAYGQVMENLLGLLGIKPVEEM